MTPESNLKSLGAKTPYIFEYNSDLLEAFPNPNPNLDPLITLECKEFTSLCPITSQPDFGVIYIRYIPKDKMVESKSLKLYLFSYRNHGSFHESCINTILLDLVQLLDPKYLEVYGDFVSRGGIAIKPFVNYAIKEYQDFKEKRLLNAK